MILITRSKSDAHNTAEQLMRRGQKSLVSSVIEVQEKKIELKQVPDVALFTSVNGVRFCPQAVVDSTPLALTVGDATAIEARHKGFKVVESASGDASSLQQLIVDQYLDSSLLFHYFKAAHLSFELEANLANHGLKIESSVVYEAKEVSDLTPKAKNALKNRDITSVLFFSARTARIFMKIILRYEALTELADVRAVCISQNVADTLDNKHWLAIDVARSPTAEALIDKLFDKRDA